MRFIIHDFKVKPDEQMKILKYPANLYRDDEVKSVVLNFINTQKHPHLIKAIKADKDPFSGDLTRPAGPSLRELNTVHIGSSKGGPASARDSADDDLFTDFTFTAKHPVPTLYMQEIFITEKGPEAHRAFNINYLHTQRKEEPNMEKIED
jgi:hypothetical protein